MQMCLSDLSAGVAKSLTEEALTDDEVLHVRTVTLAENRGRPRVWLEGRYLLDAGMGGGASYSVECGRGRVVVRLDRSGDRRVHAKRRGRAEVPVIDINNAELAASFPQAGRLEVRVGRGRIVITPARTTRKVARRVLAATAAALFAGGGLLSYAVAQAGFRPLWAVEIDERYAEVYAANHPDARMYNMSVHEAPFEEMGRMGPIGVLEMGIPCQPYSTARRLDRGGQEKRDMKLPPEAHELGDMVLWALRAADALEPQPHTIVCEQVPGFLKSGAGFIFMQALRRMGYAVDARVIDPCDYGELQARKRAVIVATTHGRVVWPTPRASSRTMAEVLLSGDHADCEWFDERSKPWLYRHAARHAARGNGFAFPEIRESDSRCPVLPRRYFAQQGSNPVVAGSGRWRAMHRWLTLTEVKRLMTLPDDYILPESKTLAGEILGQGVVCRTMTEICAAATSAA